MFRSGSVVWHKVREREKIRRKRGESTFTPHPTPPCFLARNPLHHPHNLNAWNRLASVPGSQIVGKARKKKRHAKRWRGRKINDYRLSLPSAFSDPTNFTRTFFFRVFHTSESRANSYVLLMFIWLPRVCGLEGNKSATVKVAWLPLLRLSM